MILVIVLVIIGPELINDYQVYKNKGMVTYLNDISKQELISKELINETIQALNEQNLTLNYIQYAITELEGIKAPKPYQKHKEAIEKILNKQLTLFNHLEVSIITDSLNIEQINYYLDEINILHKAQNNILIDIFNEENIKYKILEDGSIRYWYKTDAFNFH